MYSARVGKGSTTSAALGFYLPQSLAEELHVRPGDEFMAILEQIVTGDAKMVAQVNHVFKPTSKGWCTINKHYVAALRIQEGTTVLMRIVDGAKNEL